MLTNFQAESFKKIEDTKTIVKLYKTEPGEYYEITGSSIASTLTTDSMLSPAATQFYETCLSKPVYCDISGNNPGIVYVFCETVNKLCIKIATLNVTNNLFNLNYKLYILDAQSIPEQLPSLGYPSYEFTSDGILNNDPIRNITYTESENSLFSFINTSFNIKKLSVQRIDNSYSICLNNPITCTISVDLKINQDSLNNNPLSNTSYSFTFPIESFTWDDTGHLVGVGGSYNENIGNNQTAQISITMNQLQESISVGVSIVGQNFIGTPPTQTIISGSVIISNEDLPPLSDFNVSTEEDLSTSEIAGWAAYSIFSGVDFDVSFSNSFPGYVN